MNKTDVIKLVEDFEAEVNNADSINFFSTQRVIAQRIRAMLLK